MNSYLTFAGIFAITVKIERRNGSFNRYLKALRVINVENHVSSAVKVIKRRMLCTLELSGNTGKTFRVISVENHES
jgi:hypothetical protein